MRRAWRGRRSLPFLSQTRALPYRENIPLSSSRRPTGAAGAPDWGHRSGSAARARGAAGAPGLRDCGRRARGRTARHSMILSSESAGLIGGRGDLLPSSSRSACAPGPARSQRARPAGAPGPTDRGYADGGGDGELVLLARLRELAVAAGPWRGRSSLAS